MVWTNNTKNNERPNNQLVFCLNTEANMPEEPGAVVPHRALCGARRATGVSTVTAKALFYDIFWR